MPVYEFKCDCGNRETYRWSFSEHDQKKTSINCNKCFSPMKQMVSGLSFVLKGDGWYSAGGKYSYNQNELPCDDEVNRNLDTVNELEHKAISSAKEGDI